MSDYPNRTPRELYRFCLDNGIDVQQGHTKGTLETKIRNELGPPNETTLTDGTNIESRTNALLTSIRRTNGDLCIRFESTPNPMYATVNDDDTFQLWAYDYSNNQQEQVTPEKFFNGYKTAEHAIRSLAYTEYAVEIVNANDVHHSPTATTTLGKYQ